MIGYGEDPTGTSLCEQFLKSFPRAAETEFTFHVSYWDEEGDAPKKVEIIIDGQAHSMKLEDGDDFAEGVVYSAAVSGLDWGPHTYKAVAEVGGEVLDAVAGRPLRGRRAEDWNNPPELEPMDVEPWDGTPGETFTFTVLYFDMDGNVPEYVTLFSTESTMTWRRWDGQRISRRASNTLPKLTANGTHSHYFVTSTGQTWFPHAPTNPHSRRG